MVEYRVVEVPKGQAMETLKRMLDGYRRSWNLVYVGVTANPERRWERHAPAGWVKMVVVYEAFTPNIAADLERDLIDYGNRCNFRQPLANMSTGGEGIKDEMRSNWLYFLVR